MLGDDERALLAELVIDGVVAADISASKRPFWFQMFCSSKFAFKVLNVDV